MKFECVHLTIINLYTATEQVATIIASANTN